MGWTPDASRLLVATSARDRWHRGLAHLPLDGGRLTEVQADANLYRGWTLSDDGSTLVYRMSDGDRPDELYAADPNLRNPRRLTELNPWLDEVALTRSELVSSLDMDGERQYGVLYYPVGYQEGQRYSPTASRHRCCSSPAKATGTCPPRTSARCTTPSGAW